MHSPLLTRAIEGRDAVSKTMAASARNRDNPGTYVLERKLDENTTFLRWKGTIEGTNSRAWNCLPMVPTENWSSALSPIAPSLP